MDTLKERLKKTLEEVNVKMRCDKCGLELTVTKAPYTFITHPLYTCPTCNTYTLWKRK